MALSRRKKILDEERVQRLVMVLLNQWSLHVWAKLARLLLQLVDRDLSNHEREIFGGCLHLLWLSLSVQGHCDVSLGSKTELLGLNDIVDVVLVLTNCVLGSSFFTLFGRLWENFSCKTRMVHE